MDGVEPQTSGCKNTRFVEIFPKKYVCEWCKYYGRLAEIEFVHGEGFADAFRKK